MNSRLRLSLFILAGVCAARFVWHVWSGWGLITVDATKAPIGVVLNFIQKQARVRLVTNLPAETVVTMHVKKVPLIHALEVLSASTEAGWNVSYFTAPSKPAIENAVLALARGEQPDGWARFAVGGPRGLPGVAADQGASDPRADLWKPQPADPGTLQAYLQQAALMTTAQFWAPTEWNPAVSRAPKAGEIQQAVAGLTKMVHGSSEEIFFLRGRRPAAEVAEGDQEAPSREAGGRGRFDSETFRKAMDERALAQIAKLPKEEQAAARAAYDERQKFFQELAGLSPEERRARMTERMEQAMNNGEVMARMEAGATKRGAMQTADQRTDHYRSYLDRKRAATN